MAYFSLKYISCYGALNCYSFSELLQLECLTLNTVFGLFLISLMSSETDLSRNQAIQNQRNSFSRGFPLPFNVETLQAFGALFQIPQYYRKFLYYKTKMFM
jgi:hypothetical protein